MTWSVMTTRKLHTFELTFDNSTHTLQHIHWVVLYENESDILAGPIHSVIDTWEVRDNNDQKAARGQNLCFS
jgi:hypothetical protein